MIQYCIIYPFILMNRWRGSQQTWSWNKCTAVFNSMASYTMSTNMGLYLATFPRVCFVLCRVTLICEWILPIILLIIPVDIITNIVLFVLYNMQFGFNIFIRLENFGYTTCVAMILFIPSSFWEYVSRVKLTRLKYIWRKIIFKAAKKLILIDELLNVMYPKPKTSEYMENKFKYKGYLWKIYPSSLRYNPQPKPTLLHKILSIFFLIYLIINNLGDVQLRLITKPDGGNIGEILRLDQQWVMYGPDVTESTEFDVIIGRILTNSNKEYSIVLNDIVYTFSKQVTIYFNEQSYKRPINPTYITKSMRWERLFQKSNNYPGIKRSIIQYFCKKLQYKDISLNIRYPNPNNKYDDGSTYKNEWIKVNKMIYGKWCVFNGKIVNMWRQNSTQNYPEYKDEYLFCYDQISC